MEGHAEGLEEGRAEGLEEGRAEGRAEGLKEGRAATNLDHARKMKSMGMDIKMIAEITGLSEEEIEKV